MSNSERVELIRLGVLQLSDRIPGLEFQSKRHNFSAVVMQCDESLKILGKLTNAVNELRAIHAAGAVACLPTRPAGQGRATA